METQDQKKLNLSGHEGHSGIHVCHKCGWPFPNAHPSARHRRAHKRVCGTVEGYKLDVSQDKIHLDGSDGEHVSDDDHKSIGEKTVERTISRKSSSGVGSRSSRSTRSEDEVFTDAVTEFSDTTGSEDGVMSRRNSLQNKRERGLERFTSSLEAFGDESSVSSIVLEEKQLENIQTSAAKTEENQAGITSQDDTSNSIHDSSPISVSVTSENENLVEQNLRQSSETFNGLDTADEEHQETAKSDNLSELRSTSYTEAAKDVSEQVSAAIGISEELTDSISAGGTAKLTETQTTVSYDKLECSETVDSPGKFHRSPNPVQEVESTDRNVSKSPGMIESDLKTEADESANVPDVSDDLLVQEHPSAVESSDDMLKLVAEQTKPPITKEETVGGLDQTSVLNASCGDINGLQSEEIRDEAWEDEIGSFEAHKSSVSSEKVFPEVNATDGDRGQESSVKNVEEHLLMHENGINAAKEGEGHVVYENDKSKVPDSELSVASSTLAECSVDDTSLQSKKLTVDSDVGNSEKVSTNVLLFGLEDENEPPSAESSTGCGSIVAASNDDNKEPNEPVRTHEHANLDKIIDSGNLIASYSQPEKELAPEVVREAEHASEHMKNGECIERVNTDPVEKTDECFDDATLKMSEDDASFGPSGTANVDVASCTEMIVEHASDTESEKVTEQNIAFSAVDSKKPSGQTESLESNSRHASIPSGVSDTFSVDTTAVNLSQASPEPEAVSLKAEVMEEVHYLESKPSTHLQKPEKPDNTSEIETFENQKQTALKTLLGEAIAKSRAESPTYDQNPSKNSNTEASKDDVAKEWDSPARYPVKIKTEKRRAKSKSSFWVPFLCCSSSSVNASGP